MKNEMQYMHIWDVLCSVQICDKYDTTGRMVI